MELIILARYSVSHSLFATSCSTVCVIVSCIPCTAEITITGQLFRRQEACQSLAGLVADLDLEDDEQDS